MHPIIERHQAEIVALCQEYGVVRLEVFGSVCTDEFDESRSDVDFLVQYRPNVDLGPWLQRHFELKDRLACVLGRPVDLIMAKEHRNPFIRQAINASRQLLYAT